MSLDSLSSKDKIAMTHTHLFKPRPGAHRIMALLSVALGATLTLSGCELLGLSDAPPPAQPATPPKTPDKTPPPVETPPVAASSEESGEYERPEYPEAERRNPFAIASEVIAPVGIAAVEEARPVEPLEQFALSQLSLVAIISETAVPKAMFIDPDGFGHMVKEGDRIGRQRGIITSIRDNEIDVQETSGQDDAAVSRTTTLRLSDTELRAPAEDEELSDAEREALQRLMQSEDGRRTIRSSLREQAAQPSNAQPDSSAPVGFAPPTP